MSTLLWRVVQIVRASVYAFLNVAVGPLPHPGSIVIDRRAIRDRFTSEDRP